MGVVETTVNSLFLLVLGGINKIKYSLKCLQPSLLFRVVQN